MAYTTKAKIENFLGGITIPSSFDITTIIGWVQKFIDNYCGKTFETAAGDRYFDGNGRNILEIDSFTGTPTITLLNIDGTTQRTLSVSDSGDIILGPYNTTEKFELRTSRTGTLSCFPNRQKCLKVTANWGASATVPADVEMVATELTGRLYDEKTNQGKITQVTLGDFSQSFAQIEEKARFMGAMQILDTYRDVQI